MLVEVQIKSLVELQSINVRGTTNTKFSGTTKHKC